MEPDYSTNLALNSDDLDESDSHTSSGGWEDDRDPHSDSEDEGDEYIAVSVDPSPTSHPTLPLTSRTQQTDDSLSDSMAMKLDLQIFISSGECMLHADGPADNKLDDHPCVVAKIFFFLSMLIY